MITDPYLRPDASFKRLMDEYMRYKSLVIAVDFDGTLFDFHGEGNSYDMVINLLRELKKIGCYIILFTASEKQTVSGSHPA